MTQPKKSQSMGLLIIVVFSAVLLWALTAVLWPVPVVYADGPEIIAITVTSNLETYFYDPGLDPTGGTVYFNSLAGEGAGQVLTVTATCSGTVTHFEGAPAFDDTPPPDTSAPWEITYTVEMGAETQNGIVFTVTNALSQIDTAVITFTQDITDPTVEFTDVTPPDYDDGSKWYDPDNLSAGWYFTSTVIDTLSGPALANASWDHSNDAYDQLTYDPALDGDGVFRNVDDDGDGMVTVTLTITDHVGNAASDTVLLNLDNTEPIITSPSIHDYGSPWLHVVYDLTVYYGDDMTSPQSFRVEGQSTDGTGVGLDRAQFSEAFGNPPPYDDTTPITWNAHYYPDDQDWGNGTITVNVLDLVGNSATQFFTYTRDTDSPYISYGSPPIFEDSPYLYAPYPDGTTVYYSHQMGGTAHSFTVQGNAADNGGGAGLWRATFSSPDLNDPGDDLTFPDWSGIYYVDSSASGTGIITVKVYDNVSNWSQLTFNYVEDTTAPTVELTDVTDPGYDHDPDWSEPLDELDTDGSNWYDKDDFPGGNWTFTSTTSDDGAGRASCSAFWDHSNDTYDHTAGCTLDGDGSFSGVNNDDDGTVTVTVTLTDHVGNSASDTVLFSIDNTEPTITSPYISEDSDYLYRADDLITIYYGDEMTSVQTFTVNGSSNDTGVGLDRAEFSGAFGAAPVSDTTPSTWSGRYYPDNQDWGNGTITVKVSDWLGNAAYQTFDYIRDTEPPMVDVTCPDVSSVPSWSVSWNNSSDPPPNASGLKHFDVQYKVESGGWQDWHTDTLLTQDTFGPTSPIPVQDNTTYCFRVRAEDNVSNESSYTTGEDCTTYSSGIKRVFLPILWAPDPNWGFETGDFTSWQHGGQLAQSVSTAMPYCGNYSALLGSPGYACNGDVPVGSAWLRRSVTVPSSGSPILSFQYRIYTQDYNSSEPWQYDYFAVDINGSEVLIDSNTIWPADQEKCATHPFETYPFEWKPGVVSLEAYKGKTIQITFYNYNRPDQFYNTYTYVDCVSVQ
jgi:hypothetical protein